MGTPQAAIPSLARILEDGHEVVAVYTQPDRPSGRGNKIIFSAVKEFALQHGIAVYQPTKIKTAEALVEFKSHAADVAVVVAYGRILPASFLNAFAKRAINVHFSLLPKYRGAAPVNWAIVNGESETGVTTIQMDEGLDTGDILLQRKTSIGAEETSVELMHRLSLIGAEALSKTLSALDSLPRMSQDDAAATFAPIMKREDGLIDWSMTAVEIANRVRGFQPFPTAFTYYNGLKLTIWKVREAEIAEPPISPVSGQIKEAGGDTFLVLCGGNSVLSIEELQLEGKRRMQTRDFLNGLHPKVDERLG